jgi:diguanylate cyclase (GGDEF)-like protein
LSLLVAILASYTALDLSDRISTVVEVWRRRAWLFGGAVAMGVGIWSMHFVGMLAFSLPIPLGYDLLVTLYSLAIAIAVSYFALHVVSRARLSIGRLIVGGVLMGFGIAAMHYTGMAAMRMQAEISYHPGLFATSILIAIVASIAALWIAHFLRGGDHRNVILKRVAAACVMGVAITGMHYTGMAAASFTADPMGVASTGFDEKWFALAIALFTMGFLLVTLILSRFDASTLSYEDSVSRLHGELVRLATLDPLTNLPNRATLADHIERALATARRDKTQFALLFMDLDGFKTVNDSLGHSAGDLVLVAFAQRLLECVRGSDTVARLGGDEFVVLLKSIEDQRDAEKTAEAILERMRESLPANGVPMRLTLSIGIALFPSNGNTVETLLKNADAAMYGAKNAGRGTYCLFEAGMNAAAVRALQIQRALYDALENERFTLAFQPQFGGASGKLVGAEALIRLESPDLGQLQPMDFIPIAERSGHIVEIGYWVARETCRQMRRWLDGGLPPITVAVNLSPRQLQEHDLVPSMVEIVKTEGITCDRIVFEITESAAMQDAEKTIASIREFHRHGFRIAIDDFGTGYSSLAYLQQFRVKQLKIDRFFIEGLDRNGDEGRAIVSAIIALAHSLEMEVVAEGVETASQRDLLQSLKCNELQGFLLGRPVSPDQFAQLLR